MLNLKILLSLFFKPHRFLHILFYKLQIFRQPTKITVKTHFGRNIQLVLPEIVSSLIYVTGRFEEDVEKILRKYLRKGDVFVDVGAHIGYFTLLGSQLVGEKGEVHAFEPTPSTFDLLKKNCYQYGNIILINKAVFSRNTKLLLQDFGIIYSALNSFFSPRIKKRIIGVKKQVQAISLDTYFSKIKKPDFVKIDAENAEYEIIKGMRKLLMSKKPIICMEFGGCETETATQSIELLRLLRKMNYKTFCHDNGKIKEYDAYIGVNKYMNLLCLPQKYI